MLDPTNPIRVTTDPTVIPLGGRPRFYTHSNGWRPDLAAGQSFAERCFWFFFLKKEWFNLVHSGNWIAQFNFSSLDSSYPTPTKIVIYDRFTGHKNVTALQRVCNRIIFATSHLQPSLRLQISNLIATVLQPSKIFQPYHNCLCLLHNKF